MENIAGEQYASWNGEEKEEPEESRTEIFSEQYQDHSVEIKKKIRMELEKVNENAAGFALNLSETEMELLLLEKERVLKKYRRFEMGETILPTLYETFMDSQYIQQETLIETLERLQEMFYAFKNDSLDRINDLEILNYMKEQFEGICYGDLDYLESTCMERFGEKIREKGDRFIQNQGKGEYQELSQEIRWDQDLYMEVLKELFW